MQIFILGKTKSGKSTLASHLEKYNFVSYEAGAWARKEFAQIASVSYDEYSAEYKDKLTAYAMSKLREDSYYSLKQYELFLKQYSNANSLIIGVRNPNDFIHMLRYADKNLVIVIHSEKQHNGKLALFEEGLDIILSYIHYKNKIETPIPLLQIDENQCNDASFIQTLLKEYI